MSLKIGDWTSGSGQVFVIAEIAQAHDGSLGQAMAYIEAVAKTGADAIKFQTHIAKEESVIDEPWRIKFSYEDDRRYDYWQRMEFTPEQWVMLKKKADESGLVFLSSAFSNKAVDLLEKIGMPAWKVGSGETQTFPLLEHMASTGKPILLSSGMSKWSELDETAAFLREQQADFGLFQCTSAYPAPIERVGLNVIDMMKERYGCPVGLSDHSGTTTPSLTAAARGGEMIEVHAVFSKDCFGPDTSSSLTIDEMTTMVRQIREMEVMLQNPVDKDAQAEDYKEMRRIFQKYVVAGADLAEGTVLSKSDFRYKKTGAGLLAKHVEQLVGKTLMTARTEDEPIRLEDVS